MKTCSLVFLLRENEILLAMKKRGFGAGMWNGVGGKVEAGETLEEAMIRETREEIGVTPEIYEKVAIHMFTFEDVMPDMKVHAYLCRSWKGVPIETEEMAPHWFSIAAIPYDTMWEDDRLWLPSVLEGKKLRTKFSFTADNHMTSSDIREIIGLLDA